MTELQKQFQEEKGVSFDEIPINGVHLEYITWLEAQVEALRIHDVVGQSEQLCRTFFPDGKTTSATKCQFCGKEKWEH